MSLWQGPTVSRASSPDDILTAGMDRPMSLVATLADQTVGGALSAFGSGTAIREAMTPDTVEVPREGETVADVYNRVTAAPSVSMGVGTPSSSSIGGRVGRFAGILANQDEALSEDEWRKSGDYREGIPFDRGMTPQRARALAEFYDAKRVREFYAEKRPITAFIGNLVGQATDPINYIPIFGPAVKAAAVAKAGRVAGTALVASTEAAVSTGIASVVTAPARSKFGDDVSWQSTVSEMATAALIGGAFGAVVGKVGGVIETRRLAEANRRLATLDQTQKALFSLNDAIQSLTTDGEVKLGASSADFVSKMAVLAEARTAAPDRPLAYQVFDRLEQDAPDVADGLRRNLTPAQFADEAIRARAPDVARRLEAVTQTVKTNEDAITRLRSEMMDDEAFRDTRAAMTRIEELDAKATRLEQNAAKSTSPKEQAKLQQQALGVRNQMKSVAESMDLGKLQRLQEVEAELAARTEAQNAAIANQEAARVPYEQLRQQEIQRFVRTAAGARIPPAVDLSSPVSPPLAQSAPLPADISAVKARVGKPETVQDIAEQHAVTPEGNDFPEAGELAQLETEGRLLPDEKAALEDADKTIELGNSYGEALKAAVACLL